MLARGDDPPEPPAVPGGPAPDPPGPPGPRRGHRPGQVAAQPLRGPVQGEPLGGAAGPVGRQPVQAGLGRRRGRRGRHVGQAGREQRVVRAEQRLVHRGPVEDDRQPERAELQDLGRQLQARVQVGMPPAQPDVAGRREPHRLLPASARRARSRRRCRARRASAAGSRTRRRGSCRRPCAARRRRRGRKAAREARSSPGCSTAARTCPCRPAAAACPPPPRRGPQGMSASIGGSSTHLPQAAGMLPSRKQRSSSVWHSR